MILRLKTIEYIQKPTSRKELVELEETDIEDLSEVNLADRSSDFYFLRISEFNDYIDEKHSLEYLDLNRHGENIAPPDYSEMDNDWLEYYESVVKRYKVKKYIKKLAR